MLGFNDWYIRVTRALGENQKESPHMTVFYKDTLPGGPDLRPNESWHSELLAPQVQSPLTGIKPGRPATLNEREATLSRCAVSDNNFLKRRGAALPA